MNLTDRYIGVTVLKVMAVVLIGFLALSSLFTLIEELQERDEQYRLVDALLYLAYTLPRRSYELAPYVAFLSALIGLGILSNHSEVTVLRSAGVSLIRIFASVALPVLLMVAVAFAIGEYVAPRGEAAGEALRSRSGDETISLGRGGYWYREGGVYTHVRGLGLDGELVRVLQFDVDDLHNMSTSLRASRAHFDHERRTWILENVRRTRFVEGGTEPTRHDSLPWPSEVEPQMLSAKVLVDPSKLSIADLRFQIAYMEREGLHPGRYGIALWGKILQPLGILGLVLVAVGFIVGPLREVGMGLRLTVGIVAGLGFKYLQDLFAPMSLVFDVPAWLAVAIPIGICWLGGSVLLRRAA